MSASQTSREETRGPGHTPGPWVHYHGPKDTMVSINTLDGNEVGGVWCEAWSTKDRGINETVIANARLISAAPDLLAVVKLGRQKLATYTSIYDGDKELRMLLERWDSAIAKATGGEA